MSFSGYSESMVNVGGGFLGVLVDLSGAGGKAYSESVLSMLPVALAFLILSAVGALFGFLSYSCAVISSLGLLLGLMLLQRVLRGLVSRKEA